MNEEQRYPIPCREIVSGRGYIYCIKHNNDSLMRRVISFKENAICDCPDCNAFLVKEELK